MKVLVVGDGNFSFSLAYAKRFPAHDVLATSYDSDTELTRKYKEFARIAVSLRQRGVALAHGVNATALRETLPEKAAAGGFFDKIIFNMPHLGVDHPLLNAALLAHFFASAKTVLRPSPCAEVRVTLANDQVDHWRLQEMARRQGLFVKARQPFISAQWPGYEHRRGHVDRAFPMDEAFLFIFSLFPGSGSGSGEAPVAAAALKRKESEGSARRDSDHGDAKRKRKLKALVQLDAAGNVIMRPCAQCGKEYRTERALDSHVISAHKDTAAMQELPCPHCDKRLCGQEGLRYHIRAKHAPVMTPEHQLALQSSSTHVYAAATALSQETREEKEPEEQEAQVYCAVCGLTWGSSSLHAQLAPLNDMTRYSCDKCSPAREFPDRRGYQQHMLLKHP